MRLIKSDSFGLTDLIQLFCYIFLDGVEILIIVAFAGINDIFQNDYF
jgi:hypothetical protein